MDILIPWPHILEFLEEWESLPKDKVIETLKEQAKIRECQAASLRKVIEKLDKPEPHGSVK